MSLLQRLASAYLTDRLLRSSRRRGMRRPSRGGYGYGYGSPFGRSRPRGRTGFFGPFPYYSTRTRGGGRVSVGGCCLPLALAFPAIGALVARGLLRRY